MHNTHHKLEISNVEEHSSSLMSPWSTAKIQLHPQDASTVHPKYSPVISTTSPSTSHQSQSLQRHDETTVTPSLIIFFSLPLLRVLSLSAIFLKCGCHYRLPDLLGLPSPEKGCHDEPVHLRNSSFFFFFFFFFSFFFFFTSREEAAQANILPKGTKNCPRRTTKTSVQRWRARVNHPTSIQRWRARRGDSSVEGVVELSCLWIPGEPRPQRKTNFIDGIAYCRFELPVT